MMAITEVAQPSQRIIAINPTFRLLLSSHEYFGNYDLKLCLCGKVTGLATQEIQLNNFLMN
jgi:hypothetical protein